MFISILKKAVPVPKIESFDSFLFVGPHPDDIEVACGGTVAALTKVGKKVTFLVVTDGCVGCTDPNISERQMAEIRKEEALQSAKLLGVDDVRFLMHKDGCGYDKDTVLKEIVQVILQTQPQVVFCPDHKVLSECHPDHIAVGQIATDAVFFASWPKLTERIGLFGSWRGTVLAYYYTHKPNSYVKVKKTHGLHLQAVACHKSQFSQQELLSLKRYFGLRERRFGLRSGKGRAEGFRVLSLTQQHCFPEASEF